MSSFREIQTKTEKLGYLALQVIELATQHLASPYDHVLFRKLKYLLYDIESLLPSLHKLATDIKTSNIFALQQVMKDMRQEAR